LAAGSPERAPAAGPRRRSVGTVDQLSPLARRGGGRAPRGARPRPPLPGGRRPGLLSRPVPG